MKFCLIPPPHLVELDALMPRSFCLAHWLERYPRYLGYYATNADDKFTIMDNGVYEGETVSDTTLVDLAKEVKPDVLVLPDIRGGDWKENLEKARQFVARYTADLPVKTFYMYVAQCEPGGNIFQAIAAIERLILLQPIRVRYVGIGPTAALNAMSRQIGVREPDHCKLAICNRLAAAPILPWGIQLHLLGIGDYPALYCHMPVAESADSASFCWQKQWLHASGFWPSVRKHRPDDYEHWTEETPECKANIATANMLTSGTSVGQP